MTTLDENDEAAITELLMGRKVTKVNEDTLLLDDGTLLRLFGNDGCGGCTNGYYELQALNGCDNIITRVELVNDPDDDGRSADGTFEIFVYAGEERINLVRFEGSDGNGYYGTGYTIRVAKS